MVAIIGVLAAVGIPMYNGYITNAKIKATQENHGRIIDMAMAILLDPQVGYQVRCYADLTGANLSSADLS